ncbi:hypothetical protein B0F90DRAFT_538430 [Multifurca ochricompacta]|uniref:Uncharacterized protein n=1 Tax=Multifurca ochricompacta TaxID=376703 RepID=A0AAD4MDL7_9AGAM|nr:hypothetical protein B0F90DRAFT_538430 [Multifurca ochricompacta]
MPRPALVDLPLERFLQFQSLNDKSSLSNRFTRSKRSRSPSLAHSIFSPAKRRILEQERLFSPSPHSRPYPVTTSAVAAHSLRPRRSTILRALDSYEHSLGSSSPKTNTILSIPAHPHPFPMTQPRTSPRFVASPQSKSSPSSTTLTRTSPRNRSQNVPTSSRRARRTPSPTPALIPREMPPPPDRRSVHYPGFDVHQDKHIALPCTRSKSRAMEEAARVQEGDGAKENVRLVVTSLPSKSKAKGDVTPRRSARLR